MKKGDMVRVTDGRLSGLVGVITGTNLPTTNVKEGKKKPKKTINVMWANGRHETYINQAYVEIVSRAKK